MKRLATSVRVATACVALAGAAQAPAGEATPPFVGDDDLVLKALAARLHAEAADIRGAATVEHERMKKECWKKFLVTRCLDEAGQTHRDEDAKAAGLDSRARSMERELKRREVAARDAKRAEEDTKRNPP